VPHIVAASGLGAVTGGLVGALISINIPETAARHDEQAVDRGNVLITVTTDGESRKIQNLLTSAGADTDMQSQPPVRSPLAWVRRQTCNGMSAKKGRRESPEDFPDRFRI
jgi:hypothetical protein